ncbi:hypothetical protein L3Y34_011001 [Caenorhabditis briggsae]|uniref:Band 7 domain-containing protein n=1 Tax=Caenorhabditis briggsae TaxID=6238 RepID=A0AAE8ZRR3_CAEBR|nr:hypothetical protein L3Y34_011001 [Caenorhabditis briggsae]
MDGRGYRGFYTPTLVDFIAMILAWTFLVVTFPISAFFCIKMVKEYNRMVIFRLGRLWHDNPKGPGLVLVLPFIDVHKTVDLRVMSYDVPTQEMLTRDSVTIGVDAAVYYRTSDPIASLSRVNDAHMSTRQLAQSSLRNLLGTRSLEELMTDRHGIAIQVKHILDSATLFWGIHVERVEIKDLKLPRDMCRAMAAEAEAQRESDAKIVIAQGELDASLAYHEAANELAGSPTAIHLRLLQTLVRISAIDNHTIVLPFPMEYIKKVMRKKWIHK